MASHHRFTLDDDDVSKRDRDREREEREDRQAIFSEHAATVIGFVLMAVATIVMALVAKDWGSFAFGPTGGITQLYRHNPRAFLGFAELVGITTIVLYMRRKTGEPLFPASLVFGFAWLAAAFIRVWIE